MNHIPRKNIKCTRNSHPWLNARCRPALVNKNNAEGSDAFVEMQEQCSTVLREERAKYVEELKAKLASLPKYSKQWWRLNAELLQRKAKICSILRLRDGSYWLRDAKAKADLFAKTFAAKNQLPAEKVNTPFFGTAHVELDEFVPFRSRDTKRLFKKLAEKKATGHDHISAAILKALNEQLAVPFTIVCRRLFYEACWPKV